MKHQLGPPQRTFHAGEFALVIFGAFSWSILASFVAIARWSSDVEIIAFDERHLWGLLGYQLVIAPILLVVLRHGGWRWRDFHVNYSNAGTLAGVALAAVAIALTVGTQAIFGGVPITPPSASLLAVILVSLVNPWYEELIVCAFVIESLRGRFGLATAINVSVALRVSYHLYQGPPAFVTFAVFGLLMTFFYVRTGRLWPVIFAHALLDFVALAS